MKLSSCLLVCACLLASRAVEAFLPAAVNRGAVSSTLARRASSASSSSPVALRYNVNTVAYECSLVFARTTDARATPETGDVSW